uniref:IS4 family transposase n=1 Tax=Acetatifactor sp. TaxID=1872090 RepID=UPI004055C982
MLACDGSDLPIAYNPNDKTTHRRHNSLERKEKGYNQLHLNALYDLKNRIYVDAIIQPGRSPNEAKALIDMMERSKMQEPVLLIADRGYESYNILAHAQEKGWKFLISAKDLGSRGILTHLPIPDSGTFDRILSLILTRKQTKEIKSQPQRYRCLTNKTSCDFLDASNPFYTLYFRVLRFPITENTMECIITNLDEDEFPMEEIKKLYEWRWGIERSFRELKYTIGLTNFHAKKVEFILQEIFARLIIYNFCERIITKIVVQEKCRKYSYQFNFTVAVLICREYFRNKIPPPDLEALIQKNVLPVREGRKAPRKVRPNSAVSFLYRIS